MKLDQPTLEIGRAAIRNGDLASLVTWVTAHAPLVDVKLIRDTYTSLFRYGDTEKGLKLFDRMFQDYDPAMDARYAILKLGAVVLGVLGALGGLLYLVRSIFF